jgi:hypothetical protein
VNIISRREKKSSLKTYCRSTINTTPPPKKAYRDDYNATVKDFTTTLKDVVRAVRETIWKINQIKYHEENTSILYLIK